jgi:hypothetical protein
MKGILFRNLAGKWSVKYPSVGESISSVSKRSTDKGSYWLQLPIHPEHISRYVNDSFFVEGNEIDFEIAGLDYDEVADKWYNMVAYITEWPDKKDGWDVIFDEYGGSTDVYALMDWLKENYYTPNKK